MKIYNIVCPKEYTQNGQIKKMWNNVGKLIYWEATQDREEGFTLELSMFPTTKFGVFPQKSKQEEYQKTQKLTKSEEYPTEDEISLEDIPF